MDIKQVAQILHIDAYPESLERICAQLEGDTSPACDPELIREVQDKYGAFGAHYPWVLEGAQQINADPAYSTWVKAVYAYLTDEKWGSIDDIPVPDLNGTPKQDVAMLATLIPFIPVAAKQYADYGFSQKEVGEYIREYEHSLTLTKVYTGYAGLNKTYFWWLQLFAKARVFCTHGIQFEFGNFEPLVYYLRNKRSGQVVPVCNGGLVHASGKMMVGAAGYEDTEGAYEAEFFEDDEKFCGYGVIDNEVSREPQEFPKTEWECMARPGQKGLCIHLPRGSDISRENIERAYMQACRIARKMDPDLTDIPVQCSSWLLDPGMEKILGADSNVVRFGKLFARYPGKSGGRGANNFVFPGRYQSDADLPENTRLQRGLKQHYLNGGYSYIFLGILNL